MEVTEKQIPFGQNEILDLPNGNHIQSSSCAKQLSLTSKQSHIYEKLFSPPGEPRHPSTIPIIK
jgi:hypothetical protein